MFHTFNSRTIHKSVSRFSGLLLPPPPPTTAHASPYHLEAAGGVELTLHHIEEDGDGSFAQLCLRDQCHFQYRADHFGNELYLVLTLNREMHYSGIK